MNEPQPLPGKTEKVSTLTYTTPNVLLHAKDGVVHILESRSVQIPHTTRGWFTEKQEQREVFQPHAFARFSMAGHAINALCDESVYRGSAYAASVPTATKYQALIGTEVRIYFESKKCHPDIARQFGLPEVWRNGEVCITLPNLKDE